MVVDVCGMGMTCTQWNVVIGERTNEIFVVENEFAYSCGGFDGGIGVVGECGVVSVCAYDGAMELCYEIM